MTHLGRVVMTAVAAAAVAVIPAAPAHARAACAGASALPQQSRLAKVRAATLCLINAERRERGLPPLRADRRLSRAATRHSQRMVRLRFFDHVGPRGLTMAQRVEAAGYTGWRRLGENIAWGSGSRSAPARIVADWMRSPGHRRTILDARLREIGIGVARGAPQPVGGLPAATYTTNFGAR